MEIGFPNQTTVSNLRPHYMHMCTEWESRIMITFSTGGKIRNYSLIVKTYPKYVTSRNRDSSA